MIIENKYRSRACGEVSEGDIGQVIRVAGWVENIRDHGGILFIDLRDQYGVVQVVIPNDSLLEGVRKETVVTIEGEVTRRDPETVNPKLATGTVEVRARTLEILGKVTEALPFEIGSSTDTKEEIRLKYRFLDLRNRKVKDKIILRSQVISFLRSEMERLGFTEIQTPILTASSPEGARDYLVPSRKHPGKFYALPQAPQQFKQLLMVAGFDRYFQIAPCFRDEDSRADRERARRVAAPDLRATFPQLTDREREVVALIADGLDNREVAAAAYMGEGTVRNHISSILAKLGLRNRTQIAVAYWRALR